jgi:cytochrome c oxidase subunit II
MIAQASNFVTSVNDAFIFVVAVSVFFLALITILMVVFAIKYNRKRNKKASNIRYNTPLEIAWTVIPTILVLIMFWVGWNGYIKMAHAPKDAMNVDVTAQMWQWKFKYKNGKESDTLYIPLNKPVNFRLHSLDVDHSFYIPAFRIKKDVIPNRQNTVWFTPEEEGEYLLTCAEYCGLRHSYMYTKVEVIPESTFNAWLNGKTNINLASGDSSSENQKNSGETIK